MIMPRGSACFLASGTQIEYPGEMPGLVPMHDPASVVFVDFTHKQVLFHAYA